MVQLFSTLLYISLVQLGVTAESPPHHGHVTEGLCCCSSYRFPDTEFCNDVWILHSFTEGFSLRLFQVWLGVKKILVFNLLEVNKIINVNFTYTRDKNIYKT